MRVAPTRDGDPEALFHERTCIIANSGCAVVRTLPFSVSWMYGVTVAMRKVRLPDPEIELPAVFHHRYVPSKLFSVPL